MPKKRSSSKISSSTTDSSMGLSEYFARGTHPFELTTFERREALIEGPTETPVFEQRDVSFPVDWSQNATNIVAQKYFAGQADTENREWSVKQLIGRVVEKIGSEGLKNGYFDNVHQQMMFEHELAHILVHQMAAFNSPVWFNIGVKGVAQQASACQPYGARVSTPEGMIPIGRIVEEDLVGQEVYDSNGVTRVVATKANGVKPVYKVSLFNGQSIEATADHLVLAQDSWHSGPRWVEVANLNSGMFMHLHTHRSKVDAPEPALVGAGSSLPELHEDVDQLQLSEAALAGWLQADGFVGQYDHGTNRSLTIEFQVINPEEQEWVEEHLDVVFPDVHRKVRNADNPGIDVFRIRLYGEVLRDFVERWGLLARRHDIRVPEQLYTAHTQVIEAYLRSLFQADGYVSLRARSAKVGFAVISELWTQDVQQLLSMLGIYSKRRRKLEKRANRSDMWEVSIQVRSERLRFAERIGFLCSEKNRKLGESLDMEGISAKDVKSEKILSIEPIGDAEVYDIQTESGEYLSNNVTVHNCFILHIEDSLDDITRWYAEEAKIFQNGSGAGLNLSALRSSDEPLSRGGKSSGPVTFMRAADASAGTITSGGRCLAPDQRVYTATGPVPVKDLSESGEDFVVFSYDPPAGRYAAKTARAWKQPFTKMLVELCTDKGSFRLSEDHPVRLSTGEFVKAGELKAGQSLFAGTISHTHDGYLRIGLKDGMKTKARLHRLVAEDLLPEDIDGMSVHHCDGNPFNNSPGNLEVMTQSDHASLHGKQEAQAGNHLFQNRTFAKSGSDNPMHADGDFWKDEEKVSAYKGRQSAILLADPGRAVDMQQAASQQKMLNTAFAVLNAGHKIDTFEDYVAGRKQTMGRIPSITKLRSTIDERFGSYEAFVAEVSANNHRVTEVKVLGESAVYDVEVDCPTPDDKSPSSGHNFLIWDSEDIVGSGIVVSNTRRAAKMIVLDVDHPDIEDFIWCKAEEEKKARALAAAGFDMSLNTPEGERNWASLQYQNANNSVRLSDQFLKAVEKDEDFHLIARSTGEPVKTVKARALLAQIADAAWESADPGVQYDTTINSWHTCPNHSKITASNPCCFTGDTLVDTAEGKIRFDELERRCSAREKLPYVFAWDIEARLPVLRRINRVWVAGHGAKLIEVTTDKGITVRCTPEHRFLTHAGEYVEAQHLTPGTRLRKIGRYINKQRSDRRYLNHRVTEQSGNGTVNQARFMWEQVFGPIPEGMDVHHVNGDPSDDRLENFALRDRSEHRSSGSGNPRFIEVDDRLLVQIFEEIEATPVNGRMMEVSPGRWNNYIRRNNLVGEVPMAQSPTTGGRIHGGSWEEFAQFIEQSRSLVNDRVAEVIWLDQTATVYDLEVEGTHNFAVTDQSSVHSLVVHNSEYMHVDNSSCNLASLNLMKFRREDGTFNVESFRHAAQVMFTAQEILISFADYPTEEIGDNTRAMRQIGLGYANLGAYLMASGLPYDSDEGRQVAGSITALMHCEAYAQSARIAERMGAYDQFHANEDAQLRVIRRHRTAANKLVAWEGDQDLTRAAKRAAREMVELADKNGVRNSQVTVSAPTGCLTPDAMVLTDQGLARLGELGRLDGDQWQDADFQVQTDEGPKQATKFYVNGQAQVARVVSARGYELAGTPQHQVKKVAKDGSLEWARLSDLSEGDMIPIRRGGMLGRPRQVALPPLSEPYFAGLQDVFAPHEMTADLAELVGYFMGDGSLHSRGLRLQVAGTDRDVIERLAELAQGLFGLKVGLTTYDNHYQVEIHSTQLAGWWKACGFSKSKPSATHVGKGWVPHIPAAVRASNDPEIYGAFLRGLFEADGGAYENHTVSFSSAKKCFADEVKSMLLAVGIPTNSKIDMPGNGHKGDGPVYVLRVLNRNAAQDYRAKVGFISSRKQGFLEMSDCDTSTQYSAFKHDLIPISKDLVDELCPGNGDLRRNLLQGLNRGRVSRFLVERMFEETGDPRLAHMMEYFYDTVKSCELAEESVTYDLSVPSNVTYVANGFLSHNTISFLMDCDTTGVEPDFSLVKYKKLVGGGAMTIVNQTVPPALARLGYDPQQSAEIVDFIREHNTVSDAPHMDPEHYQIFDTAIGQRSISYQGHLKMMAAIQPFMSGAISKTVNLPSDATREDIFNLYLDAWKMGLKAVAIYRDGTKTAQPLGDGSEDEDERTITSLLGDGLLRGQRRRVPDDGQAIKRRFEINSAASGKISGHIVVGLFEDGTPGEVFVNVAQAGSTLRGFIDTWSRLFSMALQYGAPLDELVAKQAFTQFEPAGFTNDKEISRAKSIPDYVVRWMAARFLDPDTHAMLGINRPEIVDHDEEKAELQRSEQEEVRPELKVAAATVAARPKTTSPQAGTSTCPKCGSMMVQTGKCMTCTGCGDTGGCG